MNFETYLFGFSKCYFIFIYIEENNSQRNRLTEKCNFKILYKDCLFQKVEIIHLQLKINRSSISETFVLFIYFFLISKFFMFI